jgi:hypothetical protein
MERRDGDSAACGDLAHGELFRKGFGTGHFHVQTS